MKKLLFFPALAFTFLMSSCGNEPDVVAPRSVSDIMVRGKWKVDLYMDANQDQTNDFAGYSFTFQQNGVVQATGNGNSFTGSWTEDLVLHTVTIQISNSNAVLQRINDQWAIADITERQIKLANNNPQDETLEIAQQ
jgi:hypothetical protein